MDEEILASENAIVMDLEEKYKPKVTDRVMDTVTAFQIAITNAQAGIEKELKRNGLRNAEVPEQEISCIDFFSFRCPKRVGFTPLR